MTTKPSRQILHVHFSYHKKNGFICFLCECFWCNFRTVHVTPLITVITKHTMQACPLSTWSIDWYLTRTGCSTWTGRSGRVKVAHWLSSRLYSWLEEAYGRLSISPPGWSCKWQQQYATPSVDTLLYHWLFIPKQFQAICYIINKCLNFNCTLHCVCHWIYDYDYKIRGPKAYVSYYIMFKINI